jgi:signal transduction histidine kinase
VSLAVEDDGKGFDWEVVASGAAPGGIGLKGRQEQFESLGGGLLIESRPGEGTRLVGYLPNTTE